MRCCGMPSAGVCLTAYLVGSCARVFLFQAEDGIRDLVRSRGLGDVYKRQGYDCVLLTDACSTPSPAYVSRAIHFLVQQLHGFLSLIHI